ncbi:MAG: hypothetical protein ACPLPW_07405, partial [bacterium]
DDQGGVINPFHLPQRKDSAGQFPGEKRVIFKILPITPKNLLTCLKVPLQLLDLIIFFEKGVR